MIKIFLFFCIKYLVILKRTVYNTKVAFLYTIIQTKKETNPKEDILYVIC